MTSSIMISPIVLLFNYASELARHIITLILVIWNFGLFKQNEQLSRINMVEPPRHRYNTRLAAKNKKQKDERLSELLLLGC